MCSMLPPDSGADSITEAIRRMNRENGQIPIIGQKPRMSGWVCPKCGIEAPQAVQNVGTPTQPILRYLTDDEGGPLPFSVAAAEIVGENEDGTQKIYKTTHCLECFNRWQRRKMMEEIRANVPQLVRKTDAP